MRGFIICYHSSLTILLLKAYQALISCSTSQLVNKGPRSTNMGKLSNLQVEIKEHRNKKNFFYVRITQGEDHL